MHPLLFKHWTDVLTWGRSEYSAATPLLHAATQLHGRRLAAPLWSEAQPDISWTSPICVITDGRLERPQSHQAGTTYNHPASIRSPLRPAQHIQAVTPSLLLSPSLVTVIMAHVSVVAALLVGVSYVVFQILNHVVASRRRIAKARELGCKEPPNEAARFPLGIDMVMSALRAEKAQLFLEWIQERTDAMGVNTCKFELSTCRLAVPPCLNDGI